MKKSIGVLGWKKKLLKMDSLERGLNKVTELVHVILVADIPYGDFSSLPPKNLFGRSSIFIKRRAKLAF